MLLSREMCAPMETYPAFDALCVLVSKHMRAVMTVMISGHACASIQADLACFLGIPIDAYLRHTCADLAVCLRYHSRRE